MLTLNELLINAQTAVLTMCHTSNTDISSDERREQILSYECVLKYWTLRNAFNCPETWLIEFLFFDKKFVTFDMYYVQWIICIWLPLWRNAHGTRSKINHKSFTSWFACFFWDSFSNRNIQYSNTNLTLSLRKNVLRTSHSSLLGQYEGIWCIGL